MLLISITKRYKYFNLFTIKRLNENYDGYACFITFVSNSEEDGLARMLGKKVYNSEEGLSIWSVPHYVM
jgi:hypothetical protein